MEKLLKLPVDLEPLHDVSDRSTEIKLRSLTLSIGISLFIAGFLSGSSAENSVFCFLFYES